MTAVPVSKSPYFFGQISVSHLNFEFLLKKWFANETVCDLNEKVLLNWFISLCKLGTASLAAAASLIQNLFAACKQHVLKDDFKCAKSGGVWAEHSKPINPRFFPHTSSPGCSASKWGPRNASSCRLESVNARSACQQARFPPSIRTFVGQTHAINSKWPPGLGPVHLLYRVVSTKSKKGRSRRANATWIRLIPSRQIPSIHLLADQGLSGSTIWSVVCDSWPL